MWVLQHTDMQSLSSHTGRQQSVVGNFFFSTSSLKRMKFCKDFLLTIKWFYCQRDSHKHGAQFEEVIVLGVLHFNDSPGVQTTSDLLPLHLNQLVGANHSKGNTRLGEEDKEDPQRDTKSRGRDEVKGSDDE